MGCSDTGINIICERLNFLWAPYDLTFFHNLIIYQNFIMTLCFLHYSRHRSFKLIMRFYELDGGRITIDGHDIAAMRRDELRSKFGMVLQDAWLFNGTIRDNIAYGSDSATPEQIMAAAQAAHVDHFVRTLPLGYETRLDDDSTNVSQGEKQLLTIARAFLADPQIPILDEATSSVDTRTEVLIQRAMAKLLQNRTSFVIAHRLSTVRDADTILVMNHGSIVEQGTHEELLARHGFYDDLYHSQFAEPLIEEAV